MVTAGVALISNYVLFVISQTVLLDIIWKGLTRKWVETEMFQKISCSEERCRRVYRDMRVGPDKNYRTEQNTRKSIPGKDREWFCSKIMQIFSIQLDKTAIASSLQRKGFRRESRSFFSIILNDSRYEETVATTQFAYSSKLEEENNAREQNSEMVHCTQSSTVLGACSEEMVKPPLLYGRT